MESKYSVIAPACVVLTLDFTSQERDSTLLSSTFSITFSTSSVVFTELTKKTYTIDITGTIDVEDILFSIITNNNANAQSKVQISGDGGITFIDVTNPIGTGLIFNFGSGLWINNTQIGQNKLQIRILGRSTDGNPANIIIREDSSVLMWFHKHVSQ